MDCTIRVAKTKALTSFAVTAKLICAFVFAYAHCWFSHEVAHLTVICDTARPRKPKRVKVDTAKSKCVGFFIKSRQARTMSTVQSVC